MRRFATAIAPLLARAWASGIVATLLVMGTTGRAQAQTEYGGTVVNSGLPGSPATLIITVSSDDGRHLEGYLAIGQPLGGSGPFQGHRSRDSVYLATISSTGDTILWRAVVHGTSLTGTYRITGGQFSGQSGMWTAQRGEAPQVPATQSVAVEVVDQSQGMVGERLLYFVREGFRRSAAFRLTEAAEPRLQVIIATMPKFEDNPNTSTMYSVVWNVVLGNESSGWTPLYLDNTLGYAGSDVVTTSAETIVARTDNLLTQVRGRLAR